MLVTELRDQPAYVLSPAVLVAGASLVFSQDLDDAYIATPFDPKVDYLQEEIIRTLRRVPAGQLWAGNPAVFVRDLSKAELANAEGAAEAAAENAAMHAAAYPPPSAEAVRNALA